MINSIYLSSPNYLMKKTKCFLKFYEPFQNATWRIYTVPCSRWNILALLYTLWSQEDRNKFCVRKKTQKFCTEVILSIDFDASVVFCQKIVNLASIHDQTDNFRPKINTILEKLKMNCCSTHSPMRFGAIMKEKNTWKISVIHFAHISNPRLCSELRGAGASIKSRRR